jgi:hypothetical protein
MVRVIQITEEILITKLICVHNSWDSVHPSLVKRGFAHTRTSVYLPCVLNRRKCISHLRSPPSSLNQMCYSLAVRCSVTFLSLQLVCCAICIRASHCGCKFGVCFPLIVRLCLVISTNVGGVFFFFSWCMMPPLETLPSPPPPENRVGE